MYDSGKDYEPEVRKTLSLFTDTDSNSSDDNENILQNNFNINEELLASEIQEKDSERSEISIREHRNSVLVPLSYDASLDGIAKFDAVGACILSLLIKQRPKSTEIIATTLLAETE